MLERSDTEIGVTKSFKWGCYAYHPLTELDRLGNPDLPFPIAFAFGDRDWLGTTGADKIVKGNRFFSSGISQIFIIKESDHATYYHNPDDLIEKMVGFFDQTIKYSFEHKPRSIKIIERQASMSAQFA